jgi:hypothetical protein
MKLGLFAIVLSVIWVVPGASGQGQAVRITAPRQNMRQTANFVDLRFEVTNPTASATSSPNFKIQLDSNDPVTTTATQQSFTGLAAGSHVVTVQLVDANGTVIPNSQAQVQFTVLPTTQNSGAASGGSQSAPSPQSKVVTTPAPSAQSLEDSLPPASSSLPILSIVGFGVLVGGVISAMRTR